MAACVCFGERSGDMLQKDERNLQIPNLYIGGSPCGPWTPQGLEGGEEDDRSECYDRQISWILEWAQRDAQEGGKTFMAYFLENSDRIFTLDEDGISYADTAQARLRLGAPDMLHEAIRVNANVHVDHHRSRGWLRGCHKCLRVE